MHPIERLRHVARASGYDADVMVREAAAGLVGLGGDPTETLTACRRIVDRQVACAPLWWLAARVLTSPDGIGEARRVVHQVTEDPTVTELRDHIPDDAVVCVVGRLARSAPVFAARGDCTAMLVDTLDDSDYAIRRLQRADVDVVEVLPGSIATAVRESTLVIIEATAVGPTRSMVPLGALAAAAVAQHLGRPVWILAGRGYLMPARMYEALARRCTTDIDVWDLDVEELDHSLVTSICGEAGPESVADALRRTDCPVAPELFRPTAF